MEKKNSGIFPNKTTFSHKMASENYHGRIPRGIFNRSLLKGLALAEFEKKTKDGQNFENASPSTSHGVINICLSCDVKLFLILT